MSWSVDETELKQKLHCIGWKRKMIEISFRMLIKTRNIQIQSEVLYSNDEWKSDINREVLPFKTPRSSKCLLVCESSAYWIINFCVWCGGGNLPKIYFESNPRNIGVPTVVYVSRGKEGEGIAYSSLEFRSLYYLFTQFILSFAAVFSSIIDAYQRTSLKDENRLRDSWIFRSSRSNLFGS